MHELKAALPENALIFAEAITNRGALEAALEPSAPGLIANVRGGGIGPGLPGSLGAQLACPERKVIGVCSDGAAMYSITALWTAAHHRIPVTYVMLNNASYRILKLNMLEYLGSAAANRRFVAMDLTDPELRFDRMAESMGVRAWRVEQPDDLPGALRAAAGGDGFDVIIDPLWGEPAAAAAKAAAPFARLVALGQSAGVEATFPSADVRNNALHIVGHTNYKVPPADSRAAYERMCAHAAAGELTADYERVSLDDAADAWERLRSGPGAKLVVFP
jgi:hypothetical protein